MSSCAQMGDRDLPTGMMVTDFFPRPATREPAPNSAANSVHPVTTLAEGRVQVETFEAETEAHASLVVAV